jgi:hypothetical protein
VKVVVDTNVVAYLLLGTDVLADEVMACFNTLSNPIAPAHWEAELRTSCGWQSDLGFCLRQTAPYASAWQGASASNR